MNTSFYINVGLFENGDVPVSLWRLQDCILFWLARVGRCWRWWRTFLPSDQSSVTTHTVLICHAPISWQCHQPQLHVACSPWITNHRPYSLCCVWPLVLSKAVKNQFCLLHNVSLCHFVSFLTACERTFTVTDQPWLKQGGERLKRLE